MDRVQENDLESVVDEVDRARAQEYALLATVLSRSPDAEMLGRLALLRGDKTPLSVAHTALGEAAARANVEGVRREYFALFDGLDRGWPSPYASYYLTGSLYGRPLAEVREALRSLGLTRRDGLSEPEDHAAILCEIMAGLAGGRFAAETDRAFFEKHLAPWIERFFGDLECAASADFYAHVGTVGRCFIAVEAAAFALAR